MDNPKVFEIAETDIARLVEVIHKNGLNYWQILRLFLTACQNLQLCADAEWRVKQRN